MPPPILFRENLACTGRTDRQRRVTPTDKQLYVRGQGAKIKAYGYLAYKQATGMMRATDMHCPMPIAQHCSNYSTACHGTWLSGATRSGHYARHCAFCNCADCCHYSWWRLFRHIFFKICSKASQLQSNQTSDLHRCAADLNMIGIVGLVFSFFSFI